MAILDAASSQQLGLGVGYRDTGPGVWRFEEGRIGEALEPPVGAVRLEAAIVDGSDVVVAGSADPVGGRHGPAEAAIWRTSDGESWHRELLEFDGTEPPTSVEDILLDAESEDWLAIAGQGMDQRDSRYSLWSSKNGTDWTRVVDASFGGSEASQVVVERIIPFGNRHLILGYEFATVGEGSGRVWLLSDLGTKQIRVPERQHNLVLMGGTEMPDGSVLIVGDEAHTSADSLVLEPVVLRLSPRLEWQEIAVSLPGEKMRREAVVHVEVVDDGVLGIAIAGDDRVAPITLEFCSL